MSAKFVKMVHFDNTRPALNIVNPMPMPLTINLFNIYVIHILLHVGAIFCLLFLYHAVFFLHKTNLICFLYMLFITQTIV